jgi:hypothetical protein
LPAGGQGVRVVLREESSFAGWVGLTTGVCSSIRLENRSIL